MKNLFLSDQFYQIRFVSQKANDVEFVVQDLEGNEIGKVFLSYVTWYKKNTGFSVTSLEEVCFGEEIVEKFKELCYVGYYPANPEVVDLGAVQFVSNWAWTNGIREYPEA